MRRGGTSLGMGIMRDSREMERVSYLSYLSYLFHKLTGAKKFINVLKRTYPIFLARIQLANCWDSRTAGTAGGNGRPE